MIRKNSLLDFFTSVDYNPYNDKQAENRCHRLGQKRFVHFYWNKNIILFVFKHNVADVVQGSDSLSTDLKRHH
jgi:hypothetical protein